MEAYTVHLCGGKAQKIAMQEDCIESLFIPQSFRRCINCNAVFLRMITMQPMTDINNVNQFHGLHSPFLGKQPSSEVPAGPYPVIVRSEGGRDVPVVQAFAFGKYLGYLKVTFDEAGNVLQSTGNPILLDSSVPEGEYSTAE